MNKKYIDRTKAIPSLNELVKEVEAIEISLATNFAYTGYASENKEKVLDLIAEGVRKCQPVGIMIAFKMGGMICHAKMLLPHGEFGKWVQDNLPICHREANNLMTLYSVGVELPTLLVLPMSAIFLIGSSSYPIELRQIIADNICGVYSLNKKEASALKVGFQNGDISSDSNFDSILKKQKSADAFNICKLEGENLIKILEKKLLRYKTLLANQKRDTDPFFRNEYTVFWESTIKVISKTISDLSQLCQGQVIKNTDDGKALKGQQARFNVAAASVSDDIDDARLEKFMTRGLCPVDYLANNDIPDHEFNAITAMNLCPGDFLANNDGGQS